MNVTTKINGFRGDNLTPQVIRYTAGYNRTARHRIVWRETVPEERAIAAIG